MEHPPHEQLEKSLEKSLEEPIEEPLEEPLEKHLIPRKWSKVSQIINLILNGMLANNVNARASQGYDIRKNKTDA
jgi:hypothetical protein